MTARDRRLRFETWCRWTGLVALALALVLPPGAVFPDYQYPDPWRGADTVAGLLARDLAEAVVYDPEVQGMLPVPGVYLLLPALPFLIAVAFRRQLRRRGRRVAVVALRALGWTTAIWLVVHNIQWWFSPGPAGVPGAVSLGLLAYEAAAVVLLVAQPRHGRNDGTAAAGALAAALALFAAAPAVWIVLDSIAAAGDPDWYAIPLPAAYGLLPGGLVAYALPSYWRTRRPGAATAAGAPRLSVTPAP